LRTTAITHDAALLLRAYGRALQPGSWYSTVAETHLTMCVLYEYD
jgi:hypothetical protein